MSVEAIILESKIRDLEPSAPVCILPDSTLAQAIESMQQRKASCVLVCQDGRLEGIFTERDILKKIVGEKVSLDLPVKQFMTPSPTTVNIDARLGDAIILMDKGDYRHVPIVDDSGRIEGLISIQDIITYLAELFPTEVLNLPPRPQHMPSREGG
jgi:CBS domain-containing protein